jgi:hypothetical protein
LPTIVTGLLGLFRHAGLHGSGCQFAPLLCSLLVLLLLHGIGAALLLLSLVSTGLYRLGRDAGRRRNHARHAGQ